MTTGNDKTGDQLVASIRKTKTGAATRKTATPGTSEKQVEVEAEQNKSAARKPAQKKKPSTQDGYSSGRRVWPD